MLELRNRTGFSAAIVPGLDRDGRDIATVVVKGTYAIGRAGLTRAEEQQPIVYADTFRGEPGLSSITYESEACPSRKGTSVVVVGHACSLRAVPSLDVSLSAGPLRKVVRVFGDRAWVSVIGGAKISDPIPFRKVPLVYERAFGGVDLGAPDDGKRPRDPRNPVGIGFTSASAPDRVEGVRLPNLEDPERLIESPADRPPVAGFGFLGRDWLPRSTFAGTYDERWQNERFPFLPDDFDDRFWSGAPASLIASRAFVGGERVRLSGCSEAGDIAFDVPGAPFDVMASIKGRVSDHPVSLEGVLIEPDEQRVMVTWRATVPCARAFLFIEWVHLREKKAA